jgi:rhodanese-related sulfurtransferase
MNQKPSSHHNNPDIEASELLSRKHQGEAMLILDVREPMEFYTHNIGGINLSLNKLSEQLNRLNFSSDAEIIIVCKAGLRSKTAQSILQHHGYKNVRNLTGGLLALRKLEC